VATTLLIFLLAPVLLINLVFVAEVAFGLARLKSPSWDSPAGRTAIIIPAHNEAQGIAAVLTALRSAASERFDILVVADNCSDDTAAIARGLRVPVVERSDPDHRGKGFALAHARAALRADPPAAVIILDADCFTNQDSLQRLTSACQQLGRATQAVYLFEPSLSVGPLVQVSSFAFLVKNLIRQRGLQRLAGSVHLTGTGMCLPWAQFERADLATASIVEDMRLGIELAQGGAHPRLIEEAIVWSPHADQSHTLGQRSRWEGGFLALARVTAPRLIAKGLATLSPHTLFAGLDLMVPPLALLALLNIVALSGAALMAWVGVVSWLPVLLLGAVGAVAAVALLLAWWREGRAFLSPAALIRLPLYPLWKLPMYLNLARSGAPKQWQRTERPGETSGG
jgi:cellulose synthase/poly-beta-1,6-N-acetylglucosamine synthase-like glycosyltransferase